MNIGLIGPSRSGKTTAFHLLTGTAPKPHEEFKHELQIGITHIPDPRVERIAAVTPSRKATCVTVEYVDTPALEAGASKTDWFTAALEGGIKHTDALLLIVRAFGADETAGGVDPLRDIRIVHDELILADLIILEKRLDRLHKQRRVKPLSHEELVESDLLERASVTLNASRPLRTLELAPAEKKALRGFQFLSEKPLLAVINAGDDNLPEVTSALESFDRQLAELRIRAIALSAKLEGEIAGLVPEEREAFMADLGVTELARDRVLHASLDLLGLLTFFTTNEKETRAWSLHKGESALDAAGTVHTDLARGFIRAEVVPWDQFVNEGGYHGCKHKGLVRLEGKEYVVHEGDILLIRHSG